VGAENNRDIIHAMKIPVYGTTRTLSGVVDQPARITRLLKSLATILMALLAASIEIPLFPALRSGHRLYQRSSPQKQISSSQPNFLKPKPPPSAHDDSQGLLF
jgi:nucleoside recognition membrane protein YjiH